MLNVNVFVLLLCFEVNGIRVDTAETNNFIVWPNDDIRTVAMSTENYGLVFKFIMALQNTPNITFRMPVYESYLPVLCDSSVSIELTQYLSGRRLSTAIACSPVGTITRKYAASQVSPTSRISHSLNPETLSSLPVTTKVPQV